jgi:hypothetical protein
LPSSPSWRGAPFTRARSSSTIFSAVPSRSLLPFALLGVALLIALGFEFVNGVHDTANNAVATVICTQALPVVAHPHLYGRQFRARLQ